MADEYIRREDALRAVQRQRGANRSPAQNEMLNRIKTDIIRAPAADVAPVVRCEDCQNWKRNVGLTDSPNGHCFEHDIDTNGRDFCSYGARMRQAKRDEGGNENG